MLRPQWVARSPLHSKEPSSGRQTFVHVILSDSEESGEAGPQGTLVNAAHEPVPYLAALLRTAATSPGPLAQAQSALDRLCLGGSQA